MNTLDDAMAGFDQVFAGRSETVNEARTAVLSWLARQAVPGDILRRVELIVSELVTNAIEASPARSYRVCAGVDDTVVVVAVTNDRPTGEVPPEHQWGPDDVLAVRGRGLEIVRALADAGVTVDEDDAGVTIAASVRRG